MWDTLWIDVHLATMDAQPDDAYGRIADGAIAAQGGRIVWVGPRDALPGRPQDLARDVIGCDGAWATPGLVDPHTHIVYAGDRSGEFEERLNGVSYEAIARRGGGILSTVQATRRASFEDLLALALQRTRRLIAGGVTTVEIKSGYGLTLEDELKQLRVARAVARHLPVRVHTTFLGAHAVPPEFAGRRGAYVDHLLDAVLPAVAAEGLADSIDAFCEGIAFQPDEVARLFDAARALGLPVRLHADQLSDLGGAALAARYRALSADHVEYASEDGIRAMAAAGTVAMLLPGAFYFVREKTVPPVELFRRHGVPMGLATDCNPGTSPTLDLTTMMNMACTLFRMTPAEALAGVTHVGARALGLRDEAGRLAVGLSADIAFWPVAGPHELSYWIGGVRPLGRVFQGRPDGPAGS
ncbi:imidazolonepropionase [Gluconacetobacter azotocaptans]|uniref:imidazolonepropionase n=1 Tax=Gluconacetobacter azotocaptans TaxID=142834 RepID=UPI001959ABEA|nr:imidazolonepropionase [Gluconacetobacter azotocaptans]MBM9400328.1 imidazolonepropionase [Gluconacetobacter azotocaptans]